MAVSRFQRRVLILVSLCVALPALLLAGVGIFLTLRIARAVEDEAGRYNTYLAQQVVEAFEQELMAQLRTSIGAAENAARVNAPVSEILAALESGTQEFQGAVFVPLNDLNGSSILSVESRPLLYAQGVGDHDGQYFAGLLLSDSQGQPMGAGGWWIDPRDFLVSHLSDVIRERLPGNPRLYGGYESTRKLAVELLGPQGKPIAKVREPVIERTTRLEYFAGPFEGYAVRVAATSIAPVVWTGRFVTIEIAFIGLMGLVLVTAALFGVRYTVRQLELAQLKSGFVSNVTHELKTPIALIRLAVETLEMKRVTSPEQEEKFIATIGRETLRLSQLVDNILDFARLEAGQRVFRFERVDVLQVVADTLEALKPRFDHQGFTVITELPDSLPLVRGDATALTHCLLNLLDNAMKYSRARREVRVSAGTRADWVTVSVTDRGIGISQGDQKRIFEKFVRLETGLVHDVKGAGLGLSLVDQIIRAHGGRVELESAPGEGSTFTLVLPAAGSVAEPSTEARQKTAS